MTLRSRLKHLERTCGKGGRCPECRGRPSTVMVAAYTFIMPDNGRDSLAQRPVSPVDASKEEANSCPGCGWQPTVIQVGEVLIENHKERSGSPKLNFVEAWKAVSDNPSSR
ncbi:MAG: hypothetical protein ACJ8FY_04085 [Gemmataceae bacterium]